MNEMPWGLTMKYYPVSKKTVKKKEIRPFSATWMDPESVILSELSQRKRNII